MSALEALHCEAERLRRWADSVPVAHQIGDWEIAYPAWPEVFSVWVDLLTNGSFQRGLDDIGADVLYLVRRDAVHRGLVRELRGTGGGDLLALTRLAVDFGDVDTQVVCAWELASLGRIDVVEAALQNLARCGDECVKLAVIVSLAEIRSPQVEQIAIANWRRLNAPSETLLASLYALARLNSRELPVVLEESESRGDNVVQAIAAVVRDSVRLEEYGARLRECSRSLSTIEHGFRCAVGSLREWASGIPAEDQVGEWECAYFDWGCIYEWWSTLIRYSNPEGWSSALGEDALFALARDSENMVMLGEIGKQGPGPVLALSRQIIRRSDPDLSFQCAIALGNWVSLDQCEALLLRLVTAREPWVRQAAFRALAKLDSHQVECLAERLWEDVASDPFERLAILDVLWQFSSPRLGDFLKRAEHSNDAELVERARLIRDAGLG